MKILVIFLSALLSILFLSGCTTNNQNAAETVKVKPARPDHCIYVGHVYSVKPSETSMHSDDPSVREKHFNILKKKAHKLGANTIVITASTSTFTKQTSSMHHDMEADAYNCPNE